MALSYCSLKFIFAFLLCLGKCSYVDASTVDGETSKLICEHIRATGAHFLEVKSSLSVMNSSYESFTSVFPTFSPDQRKPDNSKILSCVRYHVE